MPGYQQLFSAETYGDIADSPHNPVPTPHSPHDDNDETFMKCSPISDTHIQNNTCVLAPEVTEGPYYHAQGHPIRQNIAEYQDGLLLVCTILPLMIRQLKVRLCKLLDIGVIDVETCKPLPNVLVDIWQANATGYYAGVYPQISNSSAPPHDIFRLL
jgi:protocatechuate 3,4-dioxygenase beta subunit